MQDHLFYCHSLVYISLNVISTSRADELERNLCILRTEVDTKSARNLLRGFPNQKEQISGECSKLEGSGVYPDGLLRVLRESVLLLWGPPLPLTLQSSLSIADANAASSLGIDIHTYEVHRITMVSARM